MQKQKTVIIKTRSYKEVLSIKRSVPVHVQLTTTMEQDGQRDQYHFDEEGQFVELNGKYYLRYQEHQDGTITPVQFRLGTEQLHLRRSGVHETNFKFQLVEPTKTHYRTEYGIIGMMVTTNRLEVEFDPKNVNGSIDLEYQLTANDQLIGTYQVQLQFAA
ncbi:DUF1934 domain-containing protein [Limosilactobacillus fastidiosus]|uniref:DUF1934 domain-containing protein n=1 Tax=Limosilactobacillus fastidiosus TaxID=2759855 RepID=UPI0027E1A7CB|nr:DUF1934 domain-containing protein [Limosilactobacillus fastidiosus]